MMIKIQKRRGNLTRLLVQPAGELVSDARQHAPARPFPLSIFRDKNRRDIGKSQSTWTDSKMETASAHPASVSALLPYAQVSFTSTPSSSVSAPITNPGGTA
eukprot:COSAG01_NODE_14998_length_1386_cov_11.425796_2_plen_101_part_01